MVDWFITGGEGGLKVWGLITQQYTVILIVLFILIFISINTCQKPRTLKLKTAERITRLKKFHGEALNFTFKIHITLNSYSIFEK